MTGIACLLPRSTVPHRDRSQRQRLYRYYSARGRWVCGEWRARVALERSAVWTGEVTDEAESVLAPQVESRPRLVKVGSHTKSQVQHVVTSLRKYAIIREPRPSFRDCHTLSRGCPDRRSYVARHRTSTATPTYHHRRSTGSCAAHRRQDQLRQGLIWGLSR